MRFLSQVTTDNICLTGMKFFSVTRGLVLTVCIYIYRCNIYMLISNLKCLIYKLITIFQVAGTIVTYELVLVQFNTTQQTDASNTTIVCEVK